MKINDKGYVDWAEFLNDPNPVNVSFIKEIPDLAAPNLSKDEEEELVEFMEHMSRHLDAAIEEKQKRSSFGYRLRKWILEILGINGDVKFK